MDPLITPEYITRDPHHKDVWHHDFLRLYGRREIIKNWNLVDNELPEKIAKVIKNGLIDIVITRNVMEAAVIAALFMRETNNEYLDATYFTLKNTHLYLKYDTVLLDTSKGITVENARKRTQNVIKYCFDREYYATIDKDMQGYKLFKDVI